MSKDKTVLALVKATKICVRCGDEKPATPEFFSVSKDTADGFHGYCRPCNVAYQKEYRRRTAAGLPLDSEIKKQERLSATEKRCTICKVVKPITEFYRWTSTVDGRQSRCVICAKQAMHRTLRKTEWAERLKQHVHHKNKQWWNTESDITAGFLRDLYSRQEGTCAWFGLPLSLDIGSGLTQVSLDRLDTDRGYMQDNVALVCKAANLARNDATMEEFEIFIEVLRASLNRRR